MKSVQQCHLELLARMFEKGIIGGNYLPIETVADWCKWDNIVRKHGGGKIKAEIHKLSKWGLVDIHGKKTVASLTPDGVAVARDYLGL